MSKIPIHIAYNCLRITPVLSFYICRRFDPGGVPGPTSKLSLRVLAQMGWRETEHKGEQ